MTIKISMAAMNLKSLPDFLVLWYGTNVIDDLEFICFMITVSLGKFTCTISITNFRFAERDIIPRLSEALQLPHKTVSETVVQRCSVKKVFLEISQNSQGSTCARVSFLIKFDLCHERVKKFLRYSDAYSESWQTSKMESFVKIVNGFLSLTIFSKGCILDVSQLSEYASSIFKKSQENHLNSWSNFNEAVVIT